MARRRAGRRRGGALLVVVALLLACPALAQVAEPDAAVQLELELAAARGQKVVSEQAAAAARPDDGDGLASGAVPPGLVRAYASLERLEQALSKAPAAGGDGAQPSSALPPAVRDALEGVEAARAAVAAELAALGVVQEQPETRAMLTAKAIVKSPALAASYLFYDAQRSGALPADGRVPWRRSAHQGDLVPGGWYDAGDYIKHALTIAQSATFLAWAALDFAEGHAVAGQAGWAAAAVRWAAHYLRGCHLADGGFVGLIGNPDIDHTYWGRPEEQPAGAAKRPAYVWNASQPAGDMLGVVSAALASASVALRPDNLTDADSLLAHAEALYARGAAAPGLFSKSMPAYPWVYSSSYSHDKLMLAASWLYRATGNASYLAAAHGHWRAAGGRYGGSVSPYVSWDSLFAPAAVNMLGIAAQVGAAAVPGHSEYVGFLGDFRDVWVQANGAWSIRKTPRGLHYPSWSKWGNLRYSSNAAFVALLRAQQLAPAAAERAELLAFARAQLDYALGSTGRSYVVGWGANPPRYAHHAAASCPDPPARCDWAAFSSPDPNPQVLTGALVAGPMGPGDDTYHDKRDDYVSNEVTIDYNAGFTAGLAGLLTLDAQAAAGGASRR